MSEFIHTADEYAKRIVETMNDTSNVFANKDNREVLTHQLGFGGHTDLTALSPTGYPSMVVESLRNVVLGLPITAAQTTSLSYYHSKMNQHFTPAAVEAYGKHFRAQLPNVIAELKRDLLSRRAVIVQSPAECLTSIQFLYREVDVTKDMMLISIGGRGTGMSTGVKIAYTTEKKPMLVCHATFRSLDAAHVPADLEVLKYLTGLVMDALSLPLEPVVAYVATTGSLHLYTRDQARFDALANPVDVAA